MSCEVCQRAPSGNVHSFYPVSENKEEIYYFSFLIKSECNYVNNIIHHITTELKGKTKRWIWIINCACFGLKHLSRLELNSIMCKFLSNDICENLSHIIIMNQTFTFKLLVKSLWYSIPSYIKKKVIFDTKKDFFNLIDLNQELIDLVA